MATKKKFLLRIDEDLWNDLQAWSDDELRSVNGQIEYLLRQAVRARGRSAGTDRSKLAAGRK
jgi:hypothetical protein